ncbi:hypothetical protein [Halorubrum aidingense]|uniref:hypothetical protein n=1 Tax=Halorubrum aidingense TaxID=368623 RepID=UPI000A6D7FE8|nr:hypothetical protein [Halorubrum aidingense]
MHSEASDLTKHDAETRRDRGSEEPFGGKLFSVIDASEAQEAIADVFLYVE